MEKIMNFNQIFTVHIDGSIEALHPIQVGGVSFGPGVRFGRGVSFSGVDFSLFIGRDFRVKEENGALIILGAYQ